MSKSNYFIRVIFFEGKSLFSKIVRFFTRSNFSHVAFLLNDNKDLLEAWIIDKQFKWGKTNITNHTPGTPYVVIDIPVSKKVYDRYLEITEFIDYCKIPYDILGVIAFVIPFKLKINGRWFCSEGVYEVLKYLGILASDTPGWKISPDNLYTILTSDKFRISLIGVVEG
jgi:hypothetical protein